MEVGIRDLRNSLSRYLRKVRRGETIVVTDHGRVVARIVPAETPADIETMLSDGRVSWSGRQFKAPDKVPRVKKGRPLAEYVSQDRR